jgi:hypothetical protein
MPDCTLLGHPEVFVVGDLMALDSLPGLAEVAMQAKNESTTTTRADGQPMAVTLPLRIASSLQAGVAHTRVVKRVVRRHGKCRTVRRRVTELRPRGVIRLGRQIQIIGRLTNRDGQGIAGADLQVFASSEGGPEQLVGDVHPDASGAYT